MCYNEYMKVTFYISLIIFVFTIPSISSAEQWDTFDKVLLAGLVTMQTMDYLQTNYIFEHDEYYETNPMITKKPIVPLYFVAFTLFESWFAHKLDPKRRKIWLSICILNSASYVTGNMSLGIGFSF